MIELFGITLRRVVSSARARMFYTKSSRELVGRLLGHGGEAAYQ